MIALIVRNLKRATVFIPGIIIAYVSIKYTLPYFHRRLPAAFAVLAAYALAAYVLIPALIRIWRIIRPPTHLPLYCITPDGFASDPLNIGIIGNKNMLIDAMEKAGWHKADPLRPGHVIRHILSIVFGWSYPNAPVSTLFLFGRKQDIAFEIPIDGTNVQRHHVRFWGTTFDNSKPLSYETIHWHHRRGHLGEDKLLWVGAASLDIGLVPTKHNLQLTHMVHPDTNQERDLIVDQLSNLKLVKNSKDVKLGSAYKLVNRTWRGVLHTDGKMKVIGLDY